MIWKQWKRGKVRFTKLCALGVSKDLAAQTAGSVSRSMAHRQQPRSELCASKRLLRQAWCSQVVHWSLAQSVRTAGCGPACPVVWQGRRGDSPPYADCRDGIPFAGRLLEIDGSRLCTIDHRTAVSIPPAPVDLF